jgi:hypothetical protein
MAKLNTYYTVPPTLDDILFGTDNTIPSRTRNFTVAGLFALYNTTYNVISPTLQIVTTNGAITTNTVYLNGGALSDSINEQSSFSPGQISTVNINTGAGSSIDSAGMLSLSADGIGVGTIGTQYVTNIVDLQFPNKPAGSYTLATTSDIPSVTGFVPYTGATQDVDLGEFEIKAGQIEFDQTPTGTAGVGIMQWNDSDGTVDLGLKGGNVTLQVGQEQVLRVVNKTATNVDLLEANYQAVRVTGAQGQRLKVDLAQAINDTLSAETIGLVTETINNNQEGFITTSGLVRGINTTGSLQGETWADGDILYLSPTTAGNATKVKPVAPNHLIILGYVIRAHINQGSIFVKVDNGYEISELHDVKITTPANNNVLAYTSATDIWENKTIDTVIGYTPFELPALTSGSVLFSNGSTIAQNNTNFFWNNSSIGLCLGGTTLDSNIIFQINGGKGARISGTGSGYGYSLVRGSETGSYGNNGSGSGLSSTTTLLFNTAATERMRINSSGNILINSTTDAGYKLDVNGTVRFRAQTALSTDTTFRVRNSADNDSLLDVRNNGVATVKGAAQVISFNLTDRVYIGLNVNNNVIGVNSDNKLFIRSNGNLNIITVPNSTVIVTDSTSPSLTPSSKLTVDSTTQGFLPPRMTTTQRDAIATPAAGLMVYDSSSLAPSVYNGVNWQNVLIPNSSGNVGIGTATPATTLDVNGTIRASTLRSDVLNNAANTVTLIQFAGTGNRLFDNSGAQVANIRNSNFQIGTTTDAGYKLDVNGTARVSGTTTITPAALTGAAVTSALDIAQTWNTTGTPSAIKLNVTDTASNGSSFLLDLRVANTQLFGVTKSGFIAFGGAFGSTGALIGTSAGTLNFYHKNTTAAAYGFDFRPNSGAITATSSESGLISLRQTFSPTSGTGIFNAINLSSNLIINQTGTATGITRGLYINPTLTAAADFRAIENSVGKVCLNTTSGNTMIGTTTDAGFRLDVNGTARVSGVVTGTSFTATSNGRF